MDPIYFVLAGALVGFIVGLTGVGGGAFMTPILMSVFGVGAATAVATDLFYAAITKSGGVISHAKQKHVKWNVVGNLALGSIPAALLTGFLVKGLMSDQEGLENLLTQTLGYMLIATSFALFFRNKLKRLSIGKQYNAKRSFTLTFIMGLALGTLVTLTSVGAGAFGTAILMVLFPILAPKEVVGTDIAHAVPLTFVAGLTHHYSSGMVDWNLLGWLLLGSMPMVLVGSSFSSKIPVHYFHPILAAALLLLGINYAGNFY